MKTFVRPTLRFSVEMSLNKNTDTGDSGMESAIEWKLGVLCNV